MKLGFVSAILPECSLVEVMSFAAETGYRCVELMSWPSGKAERRYAGVTHVDAENLDDAACTRITELVRSSGVEISALGYYPNPLAPDPVEAQTAIAHLERVIGAASRLGVGTVTTFVGRDPGRSVDDNFARFREVWPGLVSLAEQRNVRIAIENCPMFFTRDEWPGGKNLAISPAIWRRMFAEIPSPNFGLNYDPSHLVWQQMNHEKPVREFASRIFHAHAKDVRVDREKLDDVGILATPLEFHCPKLPGLGDIDWGRYLSILGDAGYRGPLCVEVEDRAYEGSLADRKRALQQAYRFLSQFV
ncbi:MAG: sugar phosphate isomerase/epimerase [Deltaproteobacteria bacterium]|nr:sugar phosphate isomerase/epimerase [Deltaproteobacteria bacterium]